MGKKKRSVAGAPIADVLRTLRSLALMGLRGAVAELDRSGKDIAESVYFFFDVSPPPLFRLATSILQVDGGLGAEEATAQLEEAAAEAARRNRVLGMGAPFSPELFMRLLADVSPPGSDLGRIEGWIAKPSPPDHVRLVMMARSKLAAEHVPIVRLN